MMRRRFLLNTSLFLSASVAIGCGGGSKTAAVSGRVTYKGKPIANASVSFSPVESSGRMAATGTTDNTGHYSLGTSKINDGAQIGAYQVSIIARSADRPPKPGESLSGMPGEMIPGDPIIPIKYFAPNTSGLTFEVKKGDNTANFEIPN